MSETGAPRFDARPPAPPHGSRRFVGLRWLAAAGVALAMPKCLLCVLGYAGLVAGAGWFGPELCGGSTHPLVTAAVVLAGLLAALGLAAWLRRAGK